MYDYGNRGGGGFYDNIYSEEHEKTHKGLGVFMILWGAGWVWAYTAWFNINRYNQNSYSTAYDCCAYVTTTGSFDITSCALVENKYNTWWNVTYEFRLVCLWGISVYSGMILAGIFNMIRGARRKAHFWTMLTMIGMTCLFITQSVFRFRDQGRLCAMESYESTASSLEVPYSYWYDFGLFQWRALVAQYVIYAVGLVLMCIGAVCCKRRSTRG